ncbi:MAG TPA: N-acetylmuramoyl-L-alanine amidase [Candidatus Deferrimicrobium sp.]|nr:N-acetylmuramoyl-L-alanine amidase [Candidatus Deferrimicrobium sp.]
MKEVNQYLTGAALTGKKLKAKKAVVIHWFADPMARATNVIKWWQSQANGVSAHDVIDLDGTVYHAVHYDDMAYQVGCPRGYTKTALTRLSSYPNDCVVGIECAHIDNTGKMTPETYASLVQLSARLLKQFGLTVNDLWLHSEIVGKDYKDCHRWFTTTQPSDWPKFKNDVAAVLNPVVKQAEVEDMLNVAVVINGLPDLGAAEPLADKVHGPILFKRDYAKGQKVANTVYIVGGANDPSLGDKVVFLGGADRYEVAAAVKKFLG